MTTYEILFILLLSNNTGRNFMKKIKAAFTMAEILISLTIIGVIAAITLPALQANINEKTWATQRKALYSRMSQAIEMLPSLNGYGEYVGSWSADSVTVETDTAAYAFITDGLSKVLQMNNVCDSTKLGDCGIPSKITTMQNIQGQTFKINFPQKLSDLNSNIIAAYSNAHWNYANPQKNVNTNVAAFETKNGESVAVFYNPYCLGRDIVPQVESHAELRDDTVTVFYPWVCANFVYDLNGKKGPNKVGKDIGVITALYSTDTLVEAPFPAEKFAKNPTDGSLEYVTQDLAQQACVAQDNNSRVPTLEEVFALQYNNRLYRFQSATIWTNKVHPNVPTTAYFVGHGGMVRAEPKSQHYYVRCVKR